MTNYDDDNIFDDDDSSIISGYDDGETPVLSIAEQEKRAAAFEKEVARRRLMLRKPKNYKAKERIEAAYWLGEAGDPQAIPELLLVYKKDKTKGMKEAATYSLGMFKALKNLWDNPERQSEVYDINERIALHNKFGKRYTGGLMLLPSLGLLVTAILLFVVGGFVGQMSDEQQAVQATSVAVETESAPTPTPDTFEFGVADLTAYYNALNDDTRFLQGQMSLITQGRSQDCSTVFNNPPVYNLSAARQGDTVLVDVNTRLNEQHEALVPVRDAFMEACRTNIAIPRAEGLEMANTIIAVQRAMREIEALLFSDATGAEAPPTQAFTATPEISPTPEPTLDFAVIRPHFDTLRNIVTDMTTPVRGDAVRQQIFWTNLRDLGSSEGCEQPTIAVPEDYPLPADISARFPTLQAAAEDVNTGLALLREAVAPFASACQTLDAEVISVNLTKADLALTAFNDANALLDTIQPQ